MLQDIASNSLDTATSLSLSDTNHFIDIIGNTSLVKDTANQFFAQAGTSTPIPIKNGGQQIYQDIYPGWQTLAVETVNGDNQVLWKNTNGNFLHIWHLDNNWNWVSSEGQLGLNSAQAFTQETNFSIDTNSDGIIGNPYTLIESAGNTKLVKDPANKFFAQVGTATPIPIKNGGQQIYQDIYPGWQTLAVETVNGDNQVLWKNVAGNYLHIWHLDSNWNLVSSEGSWGLNSTEAWGKESVFAIDANSDDVIGLIGNLYSLIEPAGNTKLVKDTANKFFAQVGISTPISIKNGGQQIFPNIYQGWQTLAVETVNGDNQVLWKNVAGNFLHIWHLDNSWNLVSSEGQWGLNSAQAFTQETNFGIDTNSDGIIGNPYSLIESAGNTKLVKDTANKFFAQVGIATPIPIKNGGQQIFPNIYSGWQTLAVETVNGDNQVLWKNTSGNFLHIWHLDSNWNLVSSEGQWGLNSAEALGKESVFGIDVNSDGVIGIEKPTISISASDANAGETSTGQTTNPGQVTFTRTGNIASSLSVSYSVGGTATNGIDYNTLNGIVTFAVNSSTATVNINPIDDAIYEGNETVVLSLVNNANYVVGTANNATVVIADNAKTSHLGLVTDFNKDGKTDILWKNLSDGNLGAWSLNGTSASWIDLDDGGDKNDGAWYFVGTGDFNNDGNTDIIQRYHWVNSPGYVRIWLMNGNQRIDIKEIEAINSNDWHIAGTGDFNQDGNVDILLRNYVTGANHVWMMKNYQVIGRVDLEAVTNLNQRIVGTGDFNSDGKIDILWRNAATGDNSIWLMNGVNRASTVNVDKVADLNWHIMGAADFNNDAKSDIIWRNYANGQNLVWLMNGNTYTGDMDILDEPNRNFTIVGKSDPVGIWTADYFGNKDLSGTPTYTEGFTDITGNFDRNYVNGSVPNTPTDNFSARYQTTRYFAPGLYHITTGADDGINVRIGNEYVVNKYNQIGLYSGYFRSTGGYYPVTVEYKEDSGNASINFKLEGHQAFNDGVNTSTSWYGGVYHWNGQGTVPSFDVLRDQGNFIGSINLGSNTRSDGQKGINSQNWGQGSPNGDNARLPHDFFVMAAYTDAYFEAGHTYKAWVRSDDGYHLGVKNMGTGEWIDFTPADQWQMDAYGAAKEITFTVPQSAWYHFHFQMFEGGGDAYFDLVWKDVTPVAPPPPTPVWENPLVPGSYVVTQEFSGPVFSSNHTGIDLGSKGMVIGGRVEAVRSGTVIKASYGNGTKDFSAANNDGYGNLVIIDHGDGLKSYYAHLNSITVSVGQQVNINTQIGTLGSTGNSTGPHLHLEVRLNNVPQNPRNYISGL